MFTTRIFEGLKKVTNAVSDRGSLANIAGNSFRKTTTVNSDKTYTISLLLSHSKPFSFYITMCFVSLLHNLSFHLFLFVMFYVTYV